MPRKSTTAPGSRRQAASAKAEGSEGSLDASRAGREVRDNRGSGISFSPESPLATLLPYQRDWLADRSRFKIGCWARQTGKSFTTAAESVTDCLLRKTTWVTLSAGERQALEWMLKAREWAEAYRVALEDYQELRDSAEALLKSAEIRWPNGSRLIAIPANPATARGYSANLTLDEFAFHENPRAIWGAIYPSISNPLKGEFRVRIVSTPNGVGNKFSDLWHDPGKWSKHLIDIDTAARRGLPINVAELRAGMADPELWAQEYECQFLDSSAVLLPYDLIGKCESDQAGASVAPEFWDVSGGNPVFCGLDFGRSRDLTVCWTFERVGDVLATREVLELRGVDTPKQVEMLRPRIRRAGRISVDYTGPGVGLGDYLVKEFGEYHAERHTYGRVELVTFTQQSKVEMFSKLRMAFDGLKLRIPIAREIREDLHSVHRVPLPGGGVTYRAPHSNEARDGHADRCTALALALRAAGTGSAGAITTTDGIVVGSRRTARMPMFRPRRLQ